MKTRKACNQTAIVHKAHSVFLMPCYTCSVYDRSIYEAISQLTNTDSTPEHEYSISLWMLVD